MYLLQEAKYGNPPWKTVEQEESLEYAINLVRKWDTYDKYSYRVVDEQTGEVMFSVLIPYESRINVGDPDWLIKLIKDYGVPQEIFERAMTRWWEQRVSR